MSTRKRVLVHQKATKKRTTKTATKRYFTRYNFTRPYMVVVQGTTVRVYEMPNASNATVTPVATKYTKLVKTLRAKRVWIGQSETCEFTTGTASDSAWPTWFGGSPPEPKRQPEYAGNSVLVETARHKYVHIGASLETFTFDDELEAFWLPVASSGDVPQPLLVGKHRICFVDAEDRREVDRALFPTDLQWCDAPLYYLGKKEGLPGDMRKYG